MHYIEDYYQMEILPNPTPNLTNTNNLPSSPRQSAKSNKLVAKHIHSNYRKNGFSSGFLEKGIIERREKSGWLGRGFVGEKKTKKQIKYCDSSRLLQSKQLSTNQIDNPKKSDQLFTLKSLHSDHSLRTIQSINQDQSPHISSKMFKRTKKKAGQGWSEREKNGAKIKQCQTLVTEENEKSGEGIVRLTTRGMNQIFLQQFRRIVEECFEQKIEVSNEEHVSKLSDCILELIKHEQW